MTKELPDFEEMLAISQEVGRLTTNVAIYKNAIKALQGEVTRKVIMDERFWPGKKPPAFNYIQATFHQLGYDEETRKAMVELTNSLAHTEGSLEELKMKFQVFRDQIDVWKVKQYNKRLTDY
jgi:hypothetical protein